MGLRANWPGWSLFYRWDEKAGLLNGMRYAPNDKRTQGADKETSHEEE
jgi:hypothetical protein